MKAKIIIVNEKDEQIGLKERGTVEQKDIYRVSALWVTNSKGEILLAQRSFNKKNNPGAWGPAVAGTIDEGETYEKNIYKEAEEELGITGYKFKKSIKTNRIEEYRKHRHFTQWFKLSADFKITDFKIQKEEVEQVKWFEKEEIIKMQNEGVIFVDSILPIVKNEIKI